MTLGYILLAVAIMLFVTATCLLFHERGYRRGFRAGKTEGETLGRLGADNWWLGIEIEVDQVRRKIWKEEAQR